MPADAPSNLPAPPVEPGLKPPEEGLHVMWINEDGSFAGGCEHYIFNTANLLRERGVRSTLVYNPLAKADPVYLRAFEGAFPLVDLAGQVRDIKPDVVYVHRLDRDATLDGLRSRRVPSVRFFHDHKLFCLREHKYTTLGSATCARAIGWGCYPCLGFVKKSARWPGLQLTRVGTLRARHRANFFFDAFVAGSGYMARHLAAHGFEVSKTHVIPPYALPPRVVEVQEREKDLLLFAGGMLRGKGLDVLLRAMTETRLPARLLAAGEGKQRSLFEDLSRHLGLEGRVTFAGRMRPEELARAYSRAAALVFPSRTAETFGLVGVEAMSYETPVIVTAVGGTGEWMVDGQTGFSVPSNDSGALARAIDEILSDPARAREMGKEGKKRYEALFRPERHVTALHALFKALAGRKGAA